jgi:hypothetical protein
MICRRFTHAALFASLWGCLLLSQARANDHTESPCVADAETREEITRFLAQNGKARVPSPKAALSDSEDAPSAGNQARSPNGEGSQTNSAGSSGFDRSVVQAGEAAFNRYCTSCHDAQKSLEATKNLAAWRTTVRRMAGKPDAEIPENVHESIATYLASRNSQASQGATGGAGGTGKEGGGAAADSGPQTSLWGTFSPWWRGGGGNAVQDPGFFPGLWVGATWQNDGPVSARATGCTTCHAQNQFGLVEAAIRFNVTKYLRSRCGSKCQREQAPDVAVDAGRFIVPFGAFYQQANPGVFRTVTPPLIYNMGERIFATNLSGGTFGYPVLPMPYSDTGANLSIGLPIAENATATLDAYLVNGLQGTAANGVDFVQTYQQYFDLNSRPAGGGRFSIGGQHLRLGASVMGGQFNSTAAGAFNQAMNYLIFGADATFRWKDRLRVQFEYAQRNSDRLGTVPASIFTERVGGFYLEGEALISKHWKMSFLARYDSQSTQSLLPPPGSTLTAGTFTVQRFTYGVNWTLPGGSLLMLNEEHWFLPQGLGSVDVLGVRWAATF